LAEKARRVEVFCDVSLPKELDQSVPSFWTSQHLERPAKQEHDDSTEKIPFFFALKIPFTAIFLAEKARQLEICRETWLTKALD